MAKKLGPEQVIAKLRQIEVLVGQGRSVALACKEAGVVEQSYYRWRKEYGGLGLEQAKRLKGSGHCPERAGECPVAAAGRGSVAGEAGSARCRGGKLVAPSRRRQAVAGARAKYGLSERRACRLLSQPRGTQRYISVPRADEDALTWAIVELAAEYGRYGYRRVTALLRRDGWGVGKDRVQRLWRREGLKVPKRHRPRGRLWLNDGSCLRLRPEHANHVWSYDFVEGQTQDGRRLRVLTLIDEFTRECLALHVARRINCFAVIEVLATVMLERGIPEHIRSDNGPEMSAKAIRQWLAGLGAKTLYITPRSLWENGYCEAFNGKLQDECLKPEIFYSLKEARVVIETWRQHYNTVRPHSSLGYRSPAPVAYSPKPFPLEQSQHMH